MKVLLANGSPHTDGFTAHQLALIENTLVEEGIECVHWQLADAPIRGCNDCCACKTSHRCRYDDGGVSELIDALNEADGVVLGSPVYFAGPNGAFAAALDRAFYATCNWESTLKGKVGTVVVNLWRAGATAAIDKLNKYFLAGQMIVASSDYWNLMLNGQTIEGDDEFGERVMEVLAHNIAQTLRKTEHLRR